MKQAAARERERDLIDRMISGDEDAFDAFTGEYIPRLYRYALYRLDRNQELTGDIVQSTLCKAIAKLASFRGEAALMTWLCACCRNEIAMHFRRLNRPQGEAAHVEVESDTVPDGASLWSGGSLGSPEHALLHKETSDLVHLALDELPGHYARALEWKYLESLPVVEIATRLGVGPKAAESLLTRARSAFRKGYARLVESTQAGSTRPHQTAF